MWFIFLFTFACALNIYIHVNHSYLVQMSSAIKYMPYKNKRWNILRKKNINLSNMTISTLKVWIKNVSNEKKLGNYFLKGCR